MPLHPEFVMALAADPLMGTENCPCPVCKMFGRVKEAVQPFLVVPEGSRRDELSRGFVLLHVADTFAGLLCGTPSNPQPGAKYGTQEAEAYLRIILAHAENGVEKIKREVGLVTAEGS